MVPRRIRPFGGGCVFAYFRARLRNGEAECIPHAGWRQRSEVRK
ncbi:hypothetical protein [Paenibacillus dendritiformis]|nr:hypothetical protein [Paenibacillus dendritiformis]